MVLFLIGFRFTVSDFYQKYIVDLVFPDHINIAELFLFR